VARRYGRFFQLRRDRLHPTRLWDKRVDFTFRPFRIAPLHRKEQFDDDLAGAGDVGIEPPITGNLNDRRGLETCSPLQLQPIRK
jgi:hypothetical protein